MLLLFVLVAPVLFIVAQHQWKLGQKAPASGTVEVSHVFLIAMEGRGYHQIIGNPQAPYTNSLARAYGLAVQYSALSQRDLPNYLQLVAGSNFGITTNCSACFVSGDSLAHEIEGAGETWKAYMESMPSHCAGHNPTGRYLAFPGDPCNPALLGLLDNHDDAKSGSPYGPNCAVPKAEDVAFWRVIAAHFANNPMVMFDLLNEPQGVTAQNWLSGGGTAQCSQAVAIVGFQPMVDAIRIQDPNVMYTLHIYAEIGTGSPSTWDQDWGSLLGNYPLYYGEWAVLPNSLVPAQCQPYTSANADSDTNAFLSYMQSRNINWTAWEFRTYYLIQDYTNFTPTNFQVSWAPCDSLGQEGMGADVKNYLSCAPAP